MCSSIMLLQQLKWFDVCVVDSWVWTLRNWRRLKKTLASAMEALVDLPHASSIQWLRSVLLRMDMEFAMIMAFSRKIFVMAGR